MEKEGKQNHNKQQVLKISQYDYLQFFAFSQELLVFFFAFTHYTYMYPFSVATAGCLVECEFLMKLCVCAELGVA